ncbi:hypothetical protein R2601_03878 [Salipiger bermudensis HTCC2601]|uniref:Uncharacterized protein n=1 Tax=Salipiger bermudensis (strain DSM 26914 / JCM 13377 / KCTC 12554 / HTCC2601) TaxID=314265 RepID=Q0FW70_SALBH|nr:hypothetical protein R2601_03878 [Salipiger bermudensis HTCC2601]
MPRLVHFERKLTREEIRWTPCNGC